MRYSAIASTANVVISAPSRRGWRWEIARLLPSPAGGFFVFAASQSALTTDHVGMYVGHQTLSSPKVAARLQPPYEFLYLPAVKRVTFSSASFILGNCSCA